MPHASFSPRPALLARPRFDVVVVAASVGGLEAIGTVLARLPEDFPAPVLVAQHRAPGRASYLAPMLRHRARLAVQEARDGEPLRPAAVYVCPPDRHLRVTSGGVAALDDGPAVNFVHPAADVLFRSAAECFGPRVLAVVLTGRGQDGAAGAAQVRRRGGVVLAQSPDTCVSPSMPRAVITGGGADFVLPLPTLADALVSLVMAPSVSTALFGLPALTAA